jgi:stress response protein SCP2
MFAHDSLTNDFNQVTAFLMSERSKTLSETEWRFRAKGYGYQLRRTAFGMEVAKLSNNQLLGLMTV